MPEPEPVPQPEPTPAVEPAPRPELQQEVAPEPADSAAAAADFGLLVRHAEAVYEDILHPPLPEAPPPRQDWFSETEGLLRRLRQR